MKLAAIIPAIFPKSESKPNYDDHHETQNANARYNDDSPTIDHEDELPPKPLLPLPQLMEYNGSTALDRLHRGSSRAVFGRLFRNQF